jgi:hypothetical protein
LYFSFAGALPFGLGIIPAITLMLALTNDWHGWLWSSVLPASVPAGGHLTYQRGWWWYLSVAYR